MARIAKTLRKELMELKGLNIGDIVRVGFSRVMYKVVFINSPHYEVQVEPCFCGGQVRSVQVNEIDPVVTPHMIADWRARTEKDKLYVDGWGNVMTYKVHSTVCNTTVHAN